MPKLAVRGRVGGRNRCSPLTAVSDTLGPVKSRFAATLLVAAATACKPEVESELPICADEVLGEEAEETQAGAIPAQTWFGVLLKNYNRRTGIVQSPLKDCSGRAVEVELPPERAKCLGASAAAPLPDRALTDGDLLETPIEGSRSLLWVRAKRFDNGDALGPVAITELTKRGVAVRAIGALRAHENRARMRLEPMGSGKVLVVESDLCPKDNPKKCSRVMRLVPLQGDLFTEQALVLDDGSCLGPVQFELFREQEVTLANGDLRRFELTRNVDFTDGNVVMTETVVIKDRSARAPDEPPAVFRNATVQRPLQLEARGIVTKPGVWEKMLADFGSVSVLPAKEK